MDFERRRDLGETAAMTSYSAVYLCASLGALALASCESRQAEKEPAPKKIEIAPLRCDIDINRPGPLRRGGHASIKLEGNGVSISVEKTNAWCGPLFNTDVPALDVKAGQGVLFETCLPEGTLQLSGYQRPESGKQELHSGNQTAGIELLFNENGGPSYSSRGEADDSIVFSADLWQAEARVLLRDVRTNARLVATVAFDCRGQKTGAPHAPREAPKDAGVSPATTEGAPKLKIEQAPVPK